MVGFALVPGLFVVFGAGVGSGATTRSGAALGVVVVFGDETAGVGPGAGRDWTVGLAGSVLGPLVFGPVVSGFGELAGGTSALGTFVGALAGGTLAGGVFAGGVFAGGVLGSSPVAC